MSEHRSWPTCGTCSRKFLGWWPVEGYRIEDGLGHGARITRIVTVIATCAHSGHDRSPNRRDVQEQHARIEVPSWWSEAHVLEAIRKLVFFAPGGSRMPEHGMVTDIG